MVICNDGIFQKRTGDLISCMILSLTFKTGFDSGATQNCRPTPKLYSTLFLNLSLAKVVKPVFKARLKYSPQTFYQSSTKLPCIVNPDQLHMQHHLREFLPSCSQYT